MRSMGSRLRRGRAVKMIALCAGAGALVTMATVSLQPQLSDSGRPSVVVANSSSAPATTPTVPSAAPPVKATTFVGGDWPGMPTAGSG